MDGRSTSASTHVYAVFMKRVQQKKPLFSSHSSLLIRWLKFIPCAIGFQAFANCYEAIAGRLQHQHPPPMMQVCTLTKKRVTSNLYALLVFWPLRTRAVMRWTQRIVIRVSKERARYIHFIEIRCSGKHARHGYRVQTTANPWFAKAKKPIVHTTSS